jgi:hypothetical protein
MVRSFFPLPLDLAGPMRLVPASGNLIHLAMKPRPSLPPQQSKAGEYFALPAPHPPLGFGMKRPLLRLLAIGIAALCGCSTTRTLSVSSASPTQPVFENGETVLRSMKRNGVVVNLGTRRFSNHPERLPAFFVGVWNRGTRDLDFSPENITAYSGETRVRVYTYPELAKRVSEEAEGESSPAELPMALAGTAPTPLMRLNAAAAAAQVSSSRLTMIGGGTLGRRTIGPGRFDYRTAILQAEDIKTGQPLRLLVALDGEIHEFRFDVRNAVDLNFGFPSQEKIPGLAER